MSNQSARELFLAGQKQRDREAITNKGIDLCKRIGNQATPELCDELEKLAIKAYAQGCDPNEDMISTAARMVREISSSKRHSAHLPEHVLWILVTARARVRLSPTEPAPFDFLKGLTPEAFGESFQFAASLLEPNVAAITDSVTRAQLDTIAQYHLHVRFLWNVVLNTSTAKSTAAESWRRCAIRKAIDACVLRNVSDNTMRSRLGTSIRLSHTNMGEYARSLRDSPDDARALGVQVAFQRSPLEGVIAFRGMSIPNLAQFDVDASDICVYEALFAAFAPAMPGTGACKATVRAGISSFDYEFSEYVVRFAEWGLSKANERATRTKLRGRPALPVILEIGRGEWPFVVVDRTRREHCFVSSALHAIAEWEHRVQHLHENQLERVVERPLVHEGCCACESDSCRFD